MVSILMWILCVYVAAAVVALWLVKRQSVRRPGRHYILLADDQAPLVERYLRALRRFAERSGTEVSVTVVDAESTAETAAIADRLARDGVPVRVAAVGPHGWTRIRDWHAEGGERAQEDVWRFLREQGVTVEGEQTVLVDVRDPAEAARLRW